MCVVVLFEIAPPFQAGAVSHNHRPEYCEETPPASATFSEGFIAQIEQKRHEIDQYLGIPTPAVREPKAVTR
jgi:hypothetical protein